MDFSYFPFKLPKLITLNVNGNDCKAVEGHYFIAEFDNTDAVGHVFDKKQYLNLKIIESIVFEPGSDESKVRTMKALFEQIDAFEAEIYKLCQEAENYNKRFENDD